MNQNNSCRSKMARRVKPKVILVSKKKSLEKKILPTQEELIRALDVNPSDRTSRDIDTILSIVGQWKDFQTYIKMDQEKKEICRRITYERYDTNDIVIKQGDEPDGWYLILSGTCSIYIMVPSPFAHDAIPPSVLSTLKNGLGQDKCFLCVARKFPTQEFGSTALTNNDKRNATIVADEPSLILRVDPHLYRDTAAWVARAQTEKKANLLSHIPELQFLRSLPPEDKIFQRLGENMKENRLEVGRAIDSMNPIAEGCFIVVADGLLAKQRVVDFSNVKKDAIYTNTTMFKIPIPNGRKAVTVANYGPKTMFPDPTLKEFVAYGFSMVVVEPVTYYELKVSDMTSMLLNTQISKIKASVRNELTDIDVIKLYFAKQEAIQWQLFKKKCVQDIRESNKVERAITQGHYFARKSGIPKAIKDHKNFPPLRRVEYQGQY